MSERRGCGLPGTGGHGRDEVPLRGGLVPGEQGNPAGETGSGRFREAAKRAFGREASFQTLDPGEHGTQAERLDRERAQPELAAGRVELGTAVDARSFRR